MKKYPIVKGFSKLSKEEKLKWVLENFLDKDDKQEALLRSYWQKDNDLYERISENTLSNFLLPFSVAPHFLIAHKNYLLPFVTEESSVVAAASKAAKFWSERGGFHFSVRGTKKIGHVHFKFKNTKDKLETFFTKALRECLLESSKELDEKMKSRGGGIIAIYLRDKREVMEDYFQIEVQLNTCEAMGANFINSILEKMAFTLKKEVFSNDFFSQKERQSLDIIMSILSNFTPDCFVEAYAQCTLEEVGLIEGMPAEIFVDKFIQAVDIAKVDIYRAVTHNKGIMNGVDALAIATGNDFRAIEASCHAWASREGEYKSLSNASFKKGIFRFELALPLSIGTIGGLTNFHPLAKLSLRLLGNPSVEELMGIMAIAGLAQNFAAIYSLITKGIQEGHMRMHLDKMLYQLKVSKEEQEKIRTYFKNNKMSVYDLQVYLKELRKE